MSHNSFPTLKKKSKCFVAKVSIKQCAPSDITFALPERQRLRRPLQSRIRGTFFGPTAAITPPGIGAIVLLGSLREITITAVLLRVLALQGLTVNRLESRIVVVQLRARILVVHPETVRTWSRFFEVEGAQGHAPAAVLVGLGQVAVALGDLERVGLLAVQHSERRVSQGVRWPVHVSPEQVPETS